MALYETTLLIRQDVSNAQVDQLVEECGTILTEEGGQILFTENWGLKTLAYRMKKNRKAHYVYFHIDAPAAARTELERRLGLNEDVLRLLSVKVEEFGETPTVMMQQKGRGDKGERGERGPRGERGDRGERGERRDRGDRPDRGERGDRGDRPDRGERRRREEEEETVS